VATAVEETTDLLQHLIRNQCVNDGTVASGHEVRSTDLLASYLQSPGVALKRYEPEPGRGSLVLRIEGSDPSAPSLHLMAHIDVVPVNPAGWRHDPFGGELIDGEVWGRGAIDMLDITASMAVAVRRLLQSGFRPKGTLVYSAMADEEARGTYGAEWLIDHAWDDVKTDYLLTEFGGMRVPIGSGHKLAVLTGEKGSQWTRLRVRGTPGHGSMPYRSDNAVVKAGEVITRIGRYHAPARLDGLWRSFVDALGLSPVVRTLLTNSRTLGPAIDRAPAPSYLYSITHTTFSPNIAHGGVKVNIIPDSAEIDIDIRTIVGDDGEPVREMLRDATGDLWKDVEIVHEVSSPATESALDTPLWRVLARTTTAIVPGAALVPILTMAATDARFFRKKGVVSYGYGLLSDRIPFGDFMKMFHANDERVDVESLRLMTELWERVARDFLA
jgi:acetylornithine deacetylase/succinyl-diaminopimelate desuccinylase-like protein